MNNLVHIPKTSAEYVEVEHFRVSWTDQDNITTDITRLENDHLHHLYKWMKDRLYFTSATIIEMEIYRRFKPEMFNKNRFETACYNFQKNPDTKRLKVYGQPRNIFTLKEEDPL